MLCIAMMHSRHGMLNVPDEVPAVRQLRPAISVIAHALRDDVVSGRYGLIIGDDTSGRVPAVILRHVINGMRSQRNLGPLPLMFLPGGGGRENHDSAAHEVFVQRADWIERAARGGRVLLVTDSVQSGRTVVGFARQLAELGIAMDVCAMAALPGVAQGVPGLPAGSKYVVGSVVNGGLAIDGDHAIAGVNKFWEPAVRRDMHSREQMIGARLEGHRVAASVIAELE